MFDFLKKTKIPEPIVGTVLVDSCWGNYNKIQIERVSSDNKKILYKFLICKGDTSTSGDLYEAEWKYFVNNCYVIEE